MQLQGKIALVAGGCLTVAMLFTWRPAPGLAAEGKPLPRSVVIATHAVGSGFHADGSAIAKVVSEKSPVNMVVRPHPGPPAWLPAMDSGEIEFGVLTGSDAASTYRGVAAYKKATPNIRLVMIGAPLYVAFWAAADSPIKTVADLRGKRVPSGWTGLPVIYYNAGANLATGGLTWDDAVKVPVTELAENVRAFLEGRTDVVWHSVGAPAVQEANARMRSGVRLVAIGTSAAGLKRMAELNPGSYMTRLKKGSFLGILDDSPVQANDMYVVAPASLSQEAVEVFLKTLWDNNDELRKVTPRMSPWTRDRVVSTEAAIPFHPGAIKFFREKGVWSSELETLQQTLVKR